MVNIFSGFVVPQAAQRLQERPALAAKLKAELPDEQEYRKALSQWDAQPPLRQCVGSVLLKRVLSPTSCMDLFRDASP